MAAVLRSAFAAQKEAPIKQRNPGQESDLGPEGGIPDTTTE